MAHSWSLCHLLCVQCLSGILRSYTIKYVFFSLASLSFLLAAFQKKIHFHFLSLSFNQLSIYPWPFSRNNQNHPQSPMEILHFSSSILYLFVQSHFHFHLLSLSQPDSDCHDQSPSYSNFSPFFLAASLSHSFYLQPSPDTSFCPVCSNFAVS